MASYLLLRACRFSSFIHSSFASKLSIRNKFSNRSHCRFNPRLAAQYVPPAACTTSSEAAPPKIPLLKVTGSNISFCPACGGPTEQRIPAGEEKPRAVCTVCGLIHYQNPKMVVGCLVTHEDKVLLCKRNIEPSYGLWTLPAGYMELGESAVEGAIRETWEEAKAEVHVEAPFAQLDIPRIGQSRATLFFVRN